MPGQEKIRSTITEPPMSAATDRPATVITGSAVLGRTCDRQAPRLMPLARPSRTWSCDWTSSAPARVMRKITASWNAPSAIVGRMYDVQPSCRRSGTSRT